MTGWLHDALAQPSIRALWLAWLLSLLATFSLAVATLVYAFEQGGAPLVAYFGVASTAPGAVVTPLLMSLAVRSRSERVLRRTTAARAALVAAAGVAAVLGASPVLVVTCAALATACGSTFRPTQAVLLPWLARTPRELTAANVAATVAENTAALVGPVVAGALLVWTDADVTLLVAAVAMAAATLALRGVDVPGVTLEAPRTGRSGLLRDAVAGGRELARLAPPGGVLVLALAQTFLRGALVVLMTVFALETLDLGSSAVGWLNAALGVGGLLGAVVGARALRITRLGRSFTVGVLLWGVGTMLLAGSPVFGLALIAVAVVGVGNALEDASAFTLLPRLTQPRLAAPTLGALELVILAGLGAGALTAPTLVGQLGVRDALLAVGAGLCLITAVYALAFVRVDRAAPEPAPETELLRDLALFEGLPVVVLEGLAASLERRGFEAGSVVVAEGDRGDRYYLVTEGTAAVDVHGVPRRTLGPGDGFGEIALLRDVPRTATVTARTDLSTVSLDRDDFLRAVSADPRNRLRAEGMVAETLAHDPQVIPRRDRP